MVSDKEMKPLALYKIVRALTLCGKSGEAKQYEENLSSEFPGWVPDAATLLMMDSASAAAKQP